MIEKYLNSSKQLKLVFLLVDIRHEPNANDKQMYEWVRNAGLEPVVIATKADKINRSQLQKQLKIVKQGLELDKETVLVPFSSVTKAGVEDIWRLIEEKLSSDTDV